MGKRAKLSDVAERAGVSPTTVSRVINHKGYLSEKTIARVEAAMAELHYQPNHLARSLQGKATKLIGLVFPSLENVFYAELINQLEQSLAKRGYHSFLTISEYNGDKERDSIGMLLANQVDGMIVGAHQLTEKDYGAIHAPIVSFDRYLGENIPIVSSDNYAGGRLATRQLLQHHPKKIVMITGNNDPQSPTYQRFQGYRDEMAAANRDAVWFSMADAKTPLQKQLKLKHLLTTQEIDGLFCSDDMTALLVFNVCEELGWQIPTDLKLVGYDGTHFIKHYMPKLTTIKQPLEDMAELMVELLLARINDEPLTDKRYVLPISLLDGKSC
ncbi:MAG: LacI family DNA-binding transcriptional regulator [Aerococcus sp.]|nr:LacI family DNA-binding transcriptional regulator [Aerococcus sp.]